MQAPTPKYTTAIRFEKGFEGWILGGGETFIINELMAEIESLKKQKSCKPTKF